MDMVLWRKKDPIQIGPYLVTQKAICCLYNGCWASPLSKVALTCTQVWWTTEVGIAFARLEEGYENAMKEYYKKQVTQLNTLITMLIGHLSKGDRQKIMTICTIDVHARDVVAKMIAQKVGCMTLAAASFPYVFYWDNG